MAIMTIATRLLVMTLTVAAVVLGASTPSAACSCAMPDRYEAFARSDAVFIGEIEEIDRPELSAFREQEARFIFAVDSVYKGDVYELQSVVTHSQGATCGMEISGPGRFLVFVTTKANGGPAPDNGEVTSDLCSGNTLIETSDIDESFGDGYAPLAGTSPTGNPGLTGVAWGSIVIGTSIVLLVGYLIGTRIRRHSSPPSESAN